MGCPVLILTPMFTNNKLRG